MRRYLDKTKLVLQTQKTASPVLEETVKQNTIPRLEVQVVESAVVIELDPAPAVAATGRLVLKEAGKTHLSAFVVEAVSLVKTGTGTSSVYTFSPSISGAAIDALILANPYGVTLIGELELTSAAHGTIRSINPFQWKVIPAIARGYEAPAVIPVTGSDLPLRNITRLTGGVAATDLDAFPIANFADGQIFSVVTLIGVEPVESRWQKRAGNQATNAHTGGSYIRPPDYHAVSHAFVLVRVAGN